MKNKLLTLFAFLSIGMMSCDLGNDPDIGGTATQAMAGEYFTRLYSEPGGDLYVDYSLVTISNTAANTTNQVRINDNGNIWGFNGIFNVDLANLTFSGDLVENDLYALASPARSPFDPIGTIDTLAAALPKFMTITGGSIFRGAANVPSGTTADSIAFYATGIYYLNSFKVVGYEFDTISENPLMIDTLNLFQLEQEIEDATDGPYFLTGYKRTGFLEDEH